MLYISNTIHLIVKWVLKLILPEVFLDMSDNTYSKKISVRMNSYEEHT